MGARTVAVVASNWSMLRNEKYGSLCGWRLSLPQMPAYAWIDVPEPGSTEFAALRLPPLQLTWVPLKVWEPPIW